MALEAEIERGWALLKLDTAHLREGVAMKFVVENDEGTTIVVVPEPEIINDPDLKGAVAVKVQKLVREMSAHTVYHISDAWTGHVNMKDQELLRRVQDLGVKRASDAGLIKRREALMCSISTRSGEGALLRWFYRREQEGTIERITMEEKDKFEGPTLGRFSKLFA